MASVQWKIFEGITDWAAWLHEEEDGERSSIARRNIDVIFRRTCLADRKHLLNNYSSLPGGFCGFALLGGLEKSEKASPFVLLGAPSRAVERQHYWPAPILRVHFMGIERSRTLRKVRTELRRFKHIGETQAPSGYQLLLREENGFIVTESGDATRIAPPVATSDGAALDFRTTFSEGEKVIIKITNQSKQRIYPALLDLSSDGSVDVVLPRQGEEEPIAPGGIRGRARNSLEELLAGAAQGRTRSGSKRVGPGVWTTAERVIEVRRHASN